MKAKIRVIFIFIAAVALYHFISDSRIIEPLTKALKDDVSQVRNNAAAVLRKIKDPGAKINVYMALP
jgi:HEAT repeat protein